MQSWSSRISKGMLVKDHTGRVLGPVTAHEGETLVIDGGKDVEYVARHDRIDDLRDGAVWLKAKVAGALGLDRDRDRDTRLGDRSLDRSDSTDLKMDVIEEELDVQKRMKRAGEVTLRKEVTEERRDVTVPVVREEVRVERVPASDVRATADTAHAFKEERVSVPVMEEEVEIKKRPVVKEQVRLHKERHVEQRAASETLRKEHVEVDDSSRGAPARTGLTRDDDKTWK